MISRIDEEEEKAAGKIYQIAQNHKIPISEFPFSQPVIDKGNIFLITKFIPNLLNTEFRTGERSYHKKTYSWPRRQSSGRKKQTSSRKTNSWK